MGLCLEGRTPWPPLLTPQGLSGPRLDYSPQLVSFPSVREPGITFSHIYLLATQ